MVQDVVVLGARGLGFFGNYFLEAFISINGSEFGLLVIFFFDDPEVAVAWRFFHATGFHFRKTPVVIY